MKLKLTEKGIVAYLKAADKRGIIARNLAVYDIVQALFEYTHAAAELAGTNSAIDDNRKAG
jgi:hypothetical protein